MVPSTGPNPSRWFTNRGQIIQTVLTAIGLVIAGKNAWPDMKGNEYLSGGAILFYVLVASVIYSIGRLVRALFFSKTTDSLADQSTKNTLLYVVSGMAGIAAGLLLGITKYPPTPTGFFSSWPDAIVCDIQEPNISAATTAVFWFGGISGSRNGLGRVVNYYLVGSQMIKDPWTQNVPKDFYRYSPHLLWFREKERTLIRPETIENKIKPELRDGYEKIYLEAFPERATQGFLDCTGKEDRRTIEISVSEIISAGRAFNFAQRLK